MTIDERIQTFLIHRFKRSAKPILHFLNYRRNPNIKDSSGTTLLHLFAFASPYDLDIMQYLLDLGANINAQDDDHLTPLHLAVSCYNYEIADFIVGKKAAVNIQTLGGKTALHLLIDDMWILKQQKKHKKLKNSLNLIQNMLQSGADPNVPDKYGETPLMRAVRQSDFEIVKQLLIFGGNVHLRNIDSDTCLHLLAWSFEPNKDILMELVKYNACVNCIGSLGINVLDFMLRYHQPEKGLETVKLLIKTATLVNWEKRIFFDVDADHKFQCLEEFMDSCYAEVSRMKSFKYADKSNLCHFALNGANLSQSDKSDKDIFDEVLETLIKGDFPIYEDFIESHFHKRLLKEKLLDVNIYAKNKERKIPLHSDAISEIVTYLSERDLLNLARAYTKHFSSSFRNDKINFLTKC